MAQQRAQATVSTVAEAELDVHNAIVEEYVQDISTLAQDVRGLQQAKRGSLKLCLWQAMADLSFHTKAFNHFTQAIISSNNRDLYNT